MRTDTLFRKMMTGLLLGLLLLPLQAPNVQAQLGLGVVFDPTNYSLQVEKRVEEALRWAETIQHYAQMYTNAVNQLTTLQGVLGIVDRQLAKNMKTALLTYQVAQIIHGTRQLRNQVEGTVRYEIAALQQIDDRLKNGILNPTRDKADFETYLLYTMGRNSQKTMALLVEAATADAQISKWTTERDKLMAELYAEEATKRALEAQLAKESDNSDPYAIDSLNKSLQQSLDRITQLRWQIRQLDDFIAEAVNEYGLTMSEMENFGYSQRAAKINRRQLQQAQSNIAATFDVELLKMKTVE
ncbi:MAG TPA: hypothetical protein VJ302_36955 [Blastocatellia bacterium]|nr:hypothetical protein [Blastocatellia bacterium]